MESPTFPTVDTSCDCDGGAGDELALRSPPRRRRGYIPYSTIYESKDEVRKNGYWIPGIAVEATIVKVQRDTSTGYHILNPFIYTIELEHGRYKWKVIKRYKDFSYLSSRLMAHRAAERIKAPVRRARNRIEEVMEGSTDDNEDKDKCKKHRKGDLSPTYELRVLSKSIEIDDYNDGCIPDSTWNTVTPSTVTKHNYADSTSLPHFPVLPDSMLSEAQMNERARRLEKWLRSVLAIPINREYHETAEFLDVSRYSFINELGGKYREGKIKKRPGGNKVFIGCKQFCISWCLPWSRRWLIVKDTYVCYMDPGDEQIRLVLLFDEQFEINSPDLAVSIRVREMIVSNLQHVLMLKCPNEEDTQAWVDTIKSVVEDTGQIWLHKKRYGSSFPQRLNSYCQWFVDAKNCWEKTASLIEMAREEIFITDWWLSPEVFLRRPMAEGNHWRLDYTLKRKAESGVRIFILIYKEMEMALGLKSLYSKKHLQGLHPNIKVMRHPDHYLGSGTFFWAHHEKLLIIDQLIAFVGGIDFCYGRWDDAQHLLTDLGSVRFSPRSEQCTIEENAGEHLQRKLTGEKETYPLKHLQQVHRITEDIINEESGEKIGEKTTSTISPLDTTEAPTDTTIMDETPEQKQLDVNGVGTPVKPKTPSHVWHTPKQQKLRDVMQRAIDKVRSTTGRHSREQTPNIETTPQTTSSTIDGLDKTELLSEDGKAIVRFTNFTSNLSALEEHDTTEITNTTKEDLSHAGQSPPRMSAPGFAMEPKQRTLMRRVVSNLRSEKAKRRWRLALQPSEEAADEYIVNYCRLQETKVDMSGLQGAGKLWPGKDYVNFVRKDFVDVDLAFNDFINRYDTPRMPWHDIHSLVYGSAARDLARHFIQRWNATKTEKLKNDHSYPYLLPKSYNSVRVPRIFFEPETQRVEVQVLRSVAHWSTLIDKTEDSIQQAYLSLIANARHYVYIENQFFVSMINSADVNNEICRVLCDRIIRAHREKEIFRVFVLIPLLPGFEGDIGATSYSALLAVLHWTMLSIAKGEHSLVENLRKAGVENVQDYISFCSLRTWDELCGKLVTELIYIHSKLLIVDDLHVIIGSANINDRSQAGNRDSEVCLLITDHEFVESRMNGLPYNAGKFAFSLRKHLMREHLGLLEDGYMRTRPKQPIDVDDPVCPSFYTDIWCQAAETNTRTYEEVFRCYPTNLVETFEELLVWRAEKTLSETDPKKAHQQLSDQLVGSLVEFPIHFLRKENLSPTLASKEGLVSSSVFT